MWDLSSPTRDQTCTLSALGSEILITGPGGESFLFFSFFLPLSLFFIRANFKRYNSSSPSPHCRSQVQEAGEAMKDYCGDKVFFNVVKNVL